MAKWQDYYGVALMTAEKLGTRKIKAKIMEVKEHTMDKKGGTPETRLHVVLEGQSEELRLNFGNATKLGKAFGEETDDWVGMTIEVYTGSQQYMGKNVKGLFVNPVTAKR